MTKAKVDGRYSVVAPTAKQFPQSKLPPEEFREEETKQKCPLCKGSGKLNIKDIGLSRIKYDPCKVCGGQGMATISEIRRNMPK